MQTWPWLALVVLLMQPLSLLAQEGKIPDPDWRVARGQFTSGISNREPVDRLVVATPLIREVYFFTDLRHLQGRTVTHRWEYQGKVVSQTPFEVGGPRWRVYSKKEIEPDQVGRWSVTVIDESGWPLYTELFRYENGAPLLQPSEGLDDAQATGEVTDQRPATTSVQSPAENSLLPAAGNEATVGRIPQSDAGSAAAPAAGSAAGASSGSE
jgi:hypothetical protein